MLSKSNSSLSSPVVTAVKVEPDIQPSCTAEAISNVSITTPAVAVYLNVSSVDPIAGTYSFSLSATPLGALVLQDDNHRTDVFDLSYYVALCNSSFTCVGENTTDSINSLDYNDAPNPSEMAVGDYELNADANYVPNNKNHSSICWGGCYQFVPVNETSFVGVYFFFNTNLGNTSVASSIYQYPLSDGFKAINLCWSSTSTG